MKQRDLFAAAAPATHTQAGTRMLSRLLDHPGSPRARRWRDDLSRMRRRSRNICRRSSCVACSRHNLRRWGSRSIWRKTYGATEVVERFCADCDQEYQGFGVQCRDFLAEIAKEDAARNWSCAALEENEHDVQQLHTWLEKIRARDFFSAPQARTAADALAACERALHAFAEAIYAHEGLQGHAEDARRN
ncbi:MAG TPA: Chromate resistance protein ChrB [Candidatus Tectomicrobia bacterium]